MTCYRPQYAVLNFCSKEQKFKKPKIIYPSSVADSGERYFLRHRPTTHPVYKEVNLPCGVCFGCRMDNSRMWSLRMMHQAKFSSSSYFVTLTYSPEHMPLHGDLNYDHLQDFWKKARHSFQGSEQLRYFACGEYGDQSLRPHYHFAGFDWNIKDLRLFKNTDHGSYFLSDDLASCWGFGHVIVAPLEYQSAAYVARYVTKKMRGKNLRFLADEYADPVTGEVPSYKVERAFQSQGLGLKWYQANQQEVWDLDGCLYDNKYMVSPPRYYFKQLEKADPEKAAAIKHKRLTEHPFEYIDPARDRELLYQMEARRLQMSVLKRELI